MRKKLLLLLVLGVFAFTVTPAIAANTWTVDPDIDQEGWNTGFFAVPGGLVEGDEDSVAGYAEDGNADLVYAPLSRVFFDTSDPLSAPTYSLPCPDVQLNITCSYVAGDPQTDDMGAAAVANGTDEGIVLDDLFTFVEDYTDDTATQKRHIAQVLDILFYENKTTGNDPGAAYENPSLTNDVTDFKAAVAIGQTLDQDLADFTNTTGNSPYKQGILAGIYQQFELGDVGHDRPSGSSGPPLSTTNDDLDSANTEVGFLDQVIWQELADIQGLTGNEQGIIQKYFSVKIVGGGALDLCDVINDQGQCIVTDASNHNVTKNINIKDDIDINDNVGGSITKTTQINNP